MFGMQGQIDLLLVILVLIVLVSIRLLVWQVVSRLGMLSSEFGLNVSGLRKVLLIFWQIMFIGCGLVVVCMQICLLWMNRLVFLISFMFILWVRKVCLKQVLLKCFGVNIIMFGDLMLLVCFRVLSSRFGQWLIGVMCWWMNSLGNRCIIILWFFSMQEILLGVCRLFFSMQQLLLLLWIRLILVMCVQMLFGRFSFCIVSWYWLLVRICLVGIILVLRMCCLWQRLVRNRFSVWMCWMQLVSMCVYFVVGMLCGMVLKGIRCLVFCLLLYRVKVMLVWWNSRLVLCWCCSSCFLGVLVSQ